MDHIYEESYRSYTIEIWPDYDTDSPRDWDNLGTMVYRDRNYILGDSEIPEYYYNDLGEEVYIDDKESIIEWINANYGKTSIFLSFYAYEHSGITIHASPIDQWDSRYSGVIFITDEKIRKEYNVKRISKKLRDRIIKSLNAEIETYATFLEGGVVGYSAGEDSCGGFYDIKEAIEEAKRSIDYQIEEENKKHTKQLKEYITHNVPLQYRFI